MDNRTNEWNAYDLVQLSCFHPTSSTNEAIELGRAKASALPPQKLPVVQDGTYSLGPKIEEKVDHSVGSSANTMG